MSKAGLVKGFFIYLLGNAGSKFIGLLLLPMFTYTLTQDEYGYFEVVNAATMALLPVISFQIYEGVIRFLITTESPSEKKSVLSSSFFAMLPLFFLFNLLFVGIAEYLKLPYRYYAILFFDSYFLSFYFLRAARGLHKQFDFSVAGILSAVGVAGAAYLLLSLTPLRTEALLLSFSIGNAAAIVYLLFRLRFFSYISPSAFSPKLVREMFAYSFPLLFDAVFWWVMTLSDRLLLGYFQGSSLVGIYSVANKFPSILLFVNSIFYLAWQEHAILQENSAERMKRYAEVFRVFSGLQVGAFILLLPVSKILIQQTIAPGFDSAQHYLPFLFAGAMFSAFSAFFGLKYQLKKETMGALYTSMTGAGVNLLFNIILIPLWGAWAAAASTTLSFFIMWVLRIRNSEDFIPASMLPARQLFFSFLLCGVWSGLYYFADGWLLYAYTAVSLMIALSLNRSFAVMLMKRFRG